jgi:hypothetical protein
LAKDSDPNIQAEGVEEIRGKKKKVRAAIPARSAAPTRCRGGLEEIRREMCGRAAPGCWPSAAAAEENGGAGVPEKRDGRGSGRGGGAAASRRRRRGGLRRREGGTGK